MTETLATIVEECEVVAIVEQRARRGPQKDHKNWAVVLKAPSGKWLVSTATDWNDTGICPFEVGGRAIAAYQEWRELHFRIVEEDLR